MSAVDAVSATLLLLGAAQCLLGALGLVRLPSLLSRMQAATKPQTLGLLLILAGTALRVEPDNVATLLVVGLFQVITAPVISQLLGRSAYRAGSLRPDVLVVDELAERLAAEGVDPAGRHADRPKPDREGADREDADRPGPEDSS